MSSKDLQRLEDLAKSKLKESITKEEATHSLQRAGILNKEGKHTAPYQHLNQFISTK